jgi:hypothetical protein
MDHRFHRHPACSSSGRSARAAVVSRSCRPGWRVVSKRKLSEDLGITVRIDRLEIRPFAMNRLHGVFVADLRGDTLLAVDELRIRGFRVNIERTAHPRAPAGVVRHALRTSLPMKGDTQSNLTNLLDKLASDDTTSSGADWKVAVQRIGYPTAALQFQQREQRAAALRRRLQACGREHGGHHRSRTSERGRRFGPDRSGAHQL